MAPKARKKPAKRARTKAGRTVAPAVTVYATTDNVGITFSKIVSPDPENPTGFRYQVKGRSTSFVTEYVMLAPGEEFVIFMAGDRLMIGARERQV